MAADSFFLTIRLKKLYYFRMKVRVILAALLSLVLLVGCSHKKPTSYMPEPPIPQTGRVGINNNSEVSVRIAGYVQTRGSEIRQVELWVHIFPGQNFILHNLIDTDAGQLFNGGDKVTVYYVSDATVPGNPWTPLFSETVEVTIDGNLMIYVNSDGLYTVMPG
ncbi:MAG TPA: hypothetical protein DCZ43_04860 [candidate division Zixibacteria bacterium]|nr:hypothetical protein [candidate division Zixibacteria bacterium]